MSRGERPEHLRGIGKYERGQGLVLRAEPGRVNRPDGTYGSRVREWCFLCNESHGYHRPEEER